MFEILFFFSRLQIIYFFPILTAYANKSYVIPALRNPHHSDNFATERM